MKSVGTSLRFGASLFAMATVAALMPTSAQAQVASPAVAAPESTAEHEQDTTEEAAANSEIVVTGSSIRGVAPVGSNLIQVGPQEIAETGGQTISQVLQTVPALTSMGTSGQGQIQGSYYQPQIHQLGSSASTTTLILIDGHRTSSGGTNHTNTDPGILPINMLERVEVLAEGASSTYGSDAVAGVVNFITRKRFDGIQLAGQAAFKDGAFGYNASVLIGKTWDDGSIIAAYSRSDLEALANTARPFTDPYHIDEGGTNFRNFNCDTATLQPNGAGNIFLNATSGQQVANSAVNSPCSAWEYGSLVPHEVRNNAMVKGIQEIGNLTVTAEMVYGVRRSDANTSRGTLTTTVFGTGAQANPFYITPAGYTGTATRQTVRWKADELLGRGAKTLSGSDSFYGDIELRYRIGDRFNLSFLALAGRDESYDRTTGTINGAVANLALNGTVYANGSLTTASLPGTNIFVTQLPLTAANALDVWNPAATNRTSAAVRTALLDNKNDLRQIHGLRQLRLVADGNLFSLPGGDVGVAIGGELLRFTLDQFKFGGNGAGPASTQSTTFQLEVVRSVKSVFGEINIPIVGPEMGVPLVDSFKVNLSGRIDNYSDFGTTSNPKAAFSWDVVPGLRFRGNVSTSFVAPPLSIIGDANGVYVNSRYETFTNNIEVPVSIYPTLPQMGIAGCTATSKTCNISSLQGLRVNTGDHDAGPQKGKGWAIGFDLAPRSMPGFKLQATLWNAKVTGAVTGPQIGFVVNTPSLAYLLNFYPGGATPAQIEQATRYIPPATPLPSVTSYILQVINSNYLNLNVQGIDANVNYDVVTNGAGTFSIGNSITYFTRFKQSYGADGVEYSVLNSTGANGVFPSVQLQGRANLGWEYEGFSSNLFMNYTGKYRNFGGSSVLPTGKDSAGNPVSGGDLVKSNFVFDLNMRYEFKSGFMADKEITLNIRNLFDKEPPFYNNASGYDGYVANPLGRVISIGLQAKF
ncbi:TonB-dependent receptor domain-containing protein [Sphingomonas sp.]|jgi:iron complex outermembrane receptor protein|uniref:TonB-dependent receptor domain-containing protein n=1 Tax=Sphingomonas sp. TaxID=28214 RepID=UPI002EDAA3E8